MKPAIIVKGEAGCCGGKNSRVGPCGSDGTPAIGDCCQDLWDHVILILVRENWENVIGFENEKG